MSRTATICGVVAAALAVATTSGASAPPADDEGPSPSALDPVEQVAAVLAAAAFQDVSTAEAAGYASTIDSLGCFEHPDEGGMGVHYLDEALLDATLDVTAPEALVYELDAAGDIVGLVAHEHIVPVEAWTSDQPPVLFGQELHQHATLPLWVLHVWLWKDNPAGVFSDWNPAVRRCPDGMPIFGSDAGTAG